MARKRVKFYLPLITKMIFFARNVQIWIEKVFQISSFVDQEYDDFCPICVNITENGLKLKKMPKTPLLRI